MADLTYRLGTSIKVSLQFNEEDGTPIDTAACTYTLVNDETEAVIQAATPLVFIAAGLYEETIGYLAVTLNAGDRLRIVGFADNGAGPPELRATARIVLPVVHG